MRISSTFTFDIIIVKKKNIHANKKSDTIHQVYYRVYLKTTLKNIFFFTQVEK